MANPASRLGIIIVLIIILSAIIVAIDEGVLNRALFRSVALDPYATRLEEILLQPSLAHPFGTDHLGRDVFARNVYATRTSVWVGLGAVLLACVPGCLLGLWSAYAGGLVDEIIMRAMDILLAIPTIVLALALVGFLGRGMNNVILGIGLVNLPVFARIMRGSALRTKQSDFVEASRAIGESHIAIIFREILPNCLTPAIIQASFSVAIAIVTEASISFLGLGVQPPTSSWGLLLSDGYLYIREAWWLPVFPGLCILVTTLGFNLIGNAVRDALDPKYEVVHL